ncbi:MAG: PASTA domain-containing protein [Clostridia bacterium]|nr:PASTA domain-containing protein [Clostridia bacterium]
MKKVSPKRRLFLRAVAVFAVLSFVFGLTAVNLVRIQLIDSEQYKQQAEENQLHDTEISAERGIIYDTNGTVLAKSASVWKVYIRPSKIDNEDFKNDLCRKLSEITGVELEDIKEKADKNKYAYLVIKRQIEFEEKERIAEFLTQYYSYRVLEDNGDGALEETDKRIYYSSAVGIDPDVKRYYPYGTLASSVIGFTGTDDIGRLGVELKYDTVLTGTPGRIITAQNGKSDVMSQEFETVYDAVQGTSLVLTLDEVVQRYLEDALEQVYVDSKGVGAHGVVMDVNTGAILAMASMQNFDLNNPQHLTEEESAQLEEEYTDSAERSKARNNLLYSRWRNFIVSDTYEPGSVFKIVTAAAALEENAVPADMSFTCTGKIQVSDRTIKCHKRTGHGTQDLKHGLMNSCNPLFITVGQKLGKEKFFEYFEAFGFTEKTGVDLPAENMPVKGVNYHSLESMGIVELSSSSFGQSFQVTPIQMITAISAIANGGKLMTPYIVEKQLDENGNVISETQPVVRRQVISQQTAETVADMMEAVVTSGTGKNAYVAGYRVAGKTGTSQKLGKTGEYVASFGCFAPADDPEIAVLILVDEPVGQINGGQICTPVAAQVVEKTLEYMGVERQYTDKEIELLDTNAPNLVGSSVNDAKAMLKGEGFEVKVVGNGETVLNQMPAYNQAMPRNGIIVLYTEKDAERLTVTVPDLQQMTVSQANKYALSAGLNIKISGNALNTGELISYDQSIEPGTEAEYGKTITVYFKSNVDVGDYAD